MKFDEIISIIWYSFILKKTTHTNNLTCTVNCPKCIFTVGSLDLYSIVLFCFLPHWIISVMSWQSVWWDGLWFTVLRKMLEARLTHWCICWWLRMFDKLSWLWCNLQAFPSWEENDNISNSKKATWCLCFPNRTASWLTLKGHRKWHNKSACINSLLSQGKISSR